MGHFVCHFVCPFSPKLSVFPLASHIRPIARRRAIFLKHAFELSAQAEIGQPIEGIESVFARKSKPYSANVVLDVTSTNYVTKARLKHILALPSIGLNPVQDFNFHTHR